MGYQVTLLTWLLATAANLWRPRRRRRFNTSRPPAVFMRARNPCSRTRRRRLVDKFVSSFQIFLSYPVTL